MIANMKLKLYTESNRDRGLTANAALTLTHQILTQRVRAYRGFYASFF
jgi:hypothetical protein